MIINSTKMKKLLSTFFFLAALMNLLNAQEIIWQKTIGGNAYDYMTDALPTADGGLIVAGSSNSNISGEKTDSCKGVLDYWILKTDSLGNIQWQKTIGGNNAEQLYSLLITPDGGYLLSGISQSDSSGDKTENCIGGMDMWIVKLDAAGNIHWQNTIGGDQSDYAVDAALTNDNGYLIAGYSYSDISGDKSENSRGVVDYWLVKLDSSGNVVWDRTIGGSGIDLLRCAKATNDGFIIAGDSESGISGEKSENSFGSSDIWVVKVDSSGNLQWQKTFGGTWNDFIRGIGVNNEQGYLLGGTSNSLVSGNKTVPSKGGGSIWLIAIDSLGNELWQKSIGGSQSDYVFAVQNFQDGAYYLSGNSQSDISFDKDEDSQGIGDYWLLKIDSLGNIIWQNTIGGAADDDLSYAWPMTNGRYLLAGESASGVSGDKTEPGRGLVDYWLVVVTENNNLMSGSLFADINSNSTRDSTEREVKGHMISENTTLRKTFSQNNGNYYLSVLNPGTYDFAPANIPYYNIVPVQHSATFSGTGQQSTTNDFAFQPALTANDLIITCTPLNRFRSGGTGHYLLNYRNIGTTTIPATIIFLPDTGLSFSSSSVSPTFAQADSVVWQLGNIEPFEEGEVLVSVTLGTGFIIGDIVNSHAFIEPISGDATVSNNHATWEVPIIASFDPNDILVNRSYIQSTELVSPPFIDYIIRFQNTGNDTAFKVKINNPFPVGTDLNSFEFVASSHPVELSYENQDKTIWFTFNNILLPDSTTDEPSSHGFVRYRVKPIGTLNIGNSINNTAYIYFDYNDPVATNTAVTNIIAPVKVEYIGQDLPVSIYPNPCRESVTVSLPDGLSDKVKIELYNPVGQCVKSMIVNNRVSGYKEINIPTSDLAKGIYFLSIASEQGIITKRMVRE